MASWLGCGGGSPSPEDDAGAACVLAACDDGQFCNGAERCGGDGGACLAGEPPCAASQRCDEATRSCVTDCAVEDDADGDGFAAEACGGNDCDDTDPRRNPGATEICDPDGADEDCDPTTFGVRDQDRDGFPDARCCNGEGDAQVCGDDCDDTREAVRPGNTEACDGFDNDCDLVTDEGVSVSCYLDEDGDTYAPEGAASSSECACPAGTTTRRPEDGPDCDDTRESVRPGGIEVCDGARLDEDCDGVPNPIDLCVCADGDTRACEASGRCSTGLETCRDGRWGLCSISPAIEICNGEDDDCDGSMDEGTQLTCYRDADRDGYPRNDMSPTMACVCPDNRTTRSPGAGRTDCNDTNPDIHPGTAEICDAGGVDENCDGSANAGCTCTVPSSRVCPQPGRCATGSQSCEGGRWGTCSVSPATEVCNAEDDDCDGSTDEGLRIRCYDDADNDTYAAAGASSRLRCACLPGETSRVPGTGTSDCNDADVSVRPGATESCDRVDSNCSSGGGVDLAEDRDGDGHASPGAACTGGYPKDDCNDSDAAIHGGVAEICDGLDNDCSGTPDQGTTCQSGCTGVVRAGHAYVICRSALSWTAADTSCARMGMRLVRVDDATEDAWVRGRIPSTEEIWLGGSDVTTEGRWVWTDGVQFWQGGSGGTRLLYANWASGQPNNDSNQDYLFVRTDGRWGDSDPGNSNPNPYVCEDY